MRIVPRRAKFGNSETTQTPGEDLRATPDRCASVSLSQPAKYVDADPTWIHAPGSSTGPPHEAYQQYGHDAYFGLT